MTDATGTTGRVYDAMNRCIIKTVPGIGATLFDYDVTTPLGSYEEKTTDPKGDVSAKVYDKLGRVIAVQDAGVTKATYSYYENGLKKEVTYPTNGAKEAYTYFPNGQLQTLTNSKGSTALVSYSYTYDAAGNQLTKVESLSGGPALVTSYQYDRLNRLLKVTEPASVATEYTYDPAGNRLTEAKTTGGAIDLTMYSYNEQNRLTATLKDIGTTKQTVNYIYDNNGNLLYSKQEELTLITDSKNIPSATFSMFILGQTPVSENKFVAWESSYEYDEFNQMIKTICGSSTVENSYNGEGLRTEKTVNGKLTRYLYIEDQPVLEVDKNGVEVARNVIGTNLASRVVTDVANGTSEMYYLYNGHGDVTELISPTGTVTAEYTYDAFGVPKTATGAADNPFRFAGYQYDKETGLYYLNSRMYNPVLARFMQEDTYTGSLNDPLSLNLYAYCNNNPVIYTDPSGHRGSKTGSKSKTGNAIPQKKTVVTTPEDLDWNRDGLLDSAADRAGFDKNNDGKADWIQSGGSNNGSSSNNSSGSNSGGKSTIPADLDWNQDGIVDTTADMNKFDSNHDNVADWLQAGTKDNWAYDNSGWSEKIVVQTPEMTEIKNTQIVSSNYEWMKGTLTSDRFQSQITELLANIILDMKYDSKKGIYYSTKNSWQSNYGYFDYYDKLSFTLDSMPIRFKYGVNSEEEAQSWKIELWKGRYALAFVGGEIGVYTGEYQMASPNTTINEVFNLIDFGDDTNCASESDFLTMAYTLYDTNGIVFNRGSERTWWLTGFKKDYNLKASDLTMVVSVTLKDSAMRDAFIGDANSGLGYYGYSTSRNNSKKIIVSGNSVIFTWK